MSSTNQDMLARFEQEIAAQEDVLYGIALFYEGLALLYAGQDAVLETHRKLFRNVIQLGNAAVNRARDLLAEARQDDAKVPLVQQFTFRPGEGHPEPEVLTARARILVATYEELFPGRARDQSLSPEDTLKLMDAASLKQG